MTGHSSLNALEIRRLRKLLEVLRQSSALLNLDTLLQYLAQASAELADAEHGLILLHDSRTNHLRWAASFQPTLPRQGLSLPVENTLLGRVFARNEPLIHHRVQGDPRHCRELDRVFGRPVTTLLAVPVRFQEQTLGVLTVLNRRHGMFTPEDAETLEVLAAQAAAAIYNARLMEQIRRAYAELQRLDKMKSDFIAITSHELRTPLGLILGFATYLREVLPKEHHRYVDAIIRHALRLKELTEDLSHLENLQRATAVVERRPVDVVQLLREVHASLLDLAEAHQVTLEPIPEVSLPPVEGDRHKLRVALRQVMKNAVLYNRPQGRVWVELRSTADALHITIHDTGKGIPKEDLPYIFERFYQVEDHLTRHSEGMGLGLAIAKALIEAHGGAIWAESEEGRGSAFTIQLPLPPGATKPRADSRRREKR